MHELGAAMQRDRRERVEVADDDVGRAAVVDQRVGTAVDGDEHGAVLAYVRPERAQIVLVVESAHDHQRVATADLGRKRRQRDRLEAALGLLVDELEGVASERAQLGADAQARLLHPVVDLVRGQQLPRGQLLTVAPERVVAELDHFAVSKGVHHRSADGVEQWYPRRDDAFRTAVRIPPRDRTVGVHDGRYARGEQALGRDAIEVAVVDDRDLAPPDPLGQVLGPRADPRHTHDPRRRWALPPPEQAHRVPFPARASSRSSPERSTSSRACRRA